MKVYLAARYTRRAELAAYADRLREFGIDVTSRWLDGDHQIADDVMGTIAGDTAGRRFAEEDYADLLCADALIAFSEPPRSSNSRGGRHVELGIALGRGIPVAVVGPHENVFHYLPQVARFDHVAHAVSWALELRAAEALVAGLSAGLAGEPPDPGETS